MKDLMQNEQNITTNNIVSHLLQRGIYTITPRDLAALFQIPLSRAYYLVQKLKARRWITEVKKGHYLVGGFEPHRVVTHPFFVAVSMVVPSYVSFITALNHYGLTEQVPFTVFAVSTLRHKPIRFGQYTFQYVRLKPFKFFGYSKQMDGDLSFLMADPEKALVDSLDQIRHHYGGGIEEIAKALVRGSQSGILDSARLADYALQMRNKSLCGRLGFLAGLVGMQHPELQRLKESLPKGFIPLDPARPFTSQWNMEWKVNVNVSREQVLNHMEGVR
jgi:predicted transcriptional regulator of viral defense system